MRKNSNTPSPKLPLSPQSSSVGSGSGPGSPSPAASTGNGNAGGASGSGTMGKFNIHPALQQQQQQQQHPIYENIANSTTGGAQGASASGASGNGEPLYGNIATSSPVATLKKGLVGGTGSGSSLEPLYGNLPASPSSSSALSKPTVSASAIVSGATALKILQENPSNLKCADCSRPNPEWASFNLCVVVCINCAMIHRSFGGHVSRIRSILHHEWSGLLLDMMKSLGNKDANSVWEAEMHNQGYTKPGPEDAHTIKQSFISAKYKKGDFLKRDPNTNNELYLATQLFTYVSTPDLARTLHLLALGADPSRASPIERDGMRTPLHAAALAGQHLQAQLLVVHGADINSHDATGLTPETCARICGQVRIANWLRECRYELTDTLSRHLSVYVEEVGNLAPDDPVVLESKGLEARLDPEREAARARLALLSLQQFERLASDVYDEIDRRDAERAYRRSVTDKHHILEKAAVPHLPENPVYHSQRNQSRQKLATLSNVQFADLVSDVLFETNRRKIPRRKPTDPSSSFGGSTQNLSDLQSHPHWQDEAHIYDAVFDEEAAAKAGLLTAARPSSVSMQSREVIDSLKAELAVTKQLLAEAQMSTGKSPDEVVLKLKEALDLERAKVRSLEDQVSKTNTQTDSTLKQLSSEHEKQLKSERERAETLEKRLRSLKPDASLSEQLEAMKAKAESVQAIATSQQLRLDELTRENAALKAELQKTRSTAANVDQHKVQQLIEACSSLRDVNSKLGEERDQWVARFEDSQKHLQEMQSQQSTLQRKLATLLSENERLRGSSASATSAGAAPSTPPSKPAPAQPTSAGTRADPFASFAGDDAGTGPVVIDRARSDWEAGIQEEADKVHKAMQALMIAAKSNAHEKYEQVMDVVNSALTLLSNLCVGDEGYKVKFRAGLAILVNACRKLNVLSAKASGGDEECVQNMITLAYEIAKIAKQLVTILEHV